MCSSLSSPPADKDLSELPASYRKNLEILDHQLTRLFSLLHQMVIHEDVEFSSLQTAAVSGSRSATKQEATDLLPDATMDTPSSMSEDGDNGNE